MHARVQVIPELGEEYIAERPQVVLCIFDECVKREIFRISLYDSRVRYL